MNRRQHRALAVAHRCQALVQQYLDMLPDQDIPARTMLAEVIQHVERLADQQDRCRSRARDETRRVHVLTTMLRSRHLHPIVRALGGRIRSGTGRYKLPHPRLTGAALVAEARCAVTRAKAREAQLVAGGLPPSFLADLCGLAKVLEDSLAARARYRIGARSTRPNINLQLRRGKHLLDSLESLLYRRYWCFPQVLAAWRTARRESHADTPAMVAQPTASTLEERCAP